MFSRCDILAIDKACSEAIGGSRTMVDGRDVIVEYSEGTIYVEDDGPSFDGNSDNRYKATVYSIRTTNIPSWPRPVRSFRFNDISMLYALLKTYRTHGQLVDMII